MKISWGYGLDPLDHSPIPYQKDDDDDDDDFLKVWSNVRVGGNILGSNHPNWFIFSYTVQQQYDAA